MSTANPVIPNKSPSASKSPVPPEEQFWQRYSPHYEFPLSSVTSFAIHALCLVLLFFLGKYIFDRLSEQKKPLQELGVVVAGGGGGNPEGVGPGPGGEITEPQPAEDTGDKPPQEATPTKPDTKRENLNPSVPLVQALPETKDESVRELIQNAGDAVRAQARISKDAQEKLRRSIGYGQGGPGSDGGKDRGRDTGTGNKTGPGTGNERYERTLRWVMIFDTFSGDDYARQLAGLGAIIAIPRENNQYAIIHDLNQRPARPREEDIEQIKRIYWVDEKRESITPLCMTLGIKPVPDHVVAFFPESLERKLLKLELDYKGRTEDQIYETRFKVRKTAGGYEPVVIEQKAK
jgi:hypothetical protein